MNLSSLWPLRGNDRTPSLHVLYRRRRAMSFTCWSQYSNTERPTQISMADVIHRILELVLVALGLVGSGVSRLLLLLLP